MLIDQLNVVEINPTELCNLKCNFKCNFKELLKCSKTLGVKTSDVALESLRVECRACGARG